MEISMAPLQGFTECGLRNAFASCFGGVSEYYTPFVRLEKGAFRNKDLKDIAPQNNQVSDLVPQIIAADEEEALKLVEYVAGCGYRRLDINMGCPFPLMVRKGRGAGILSHPDRVARVLSVVHRYPEIRFSVKMRLGWDSEQEIFALLDILNGHPLYQVTLHPRLGIQQYKGKCSMDSFAAFYEQCKLPLVYNGDVMSLGDIAALESHFPRLKGVMIGRGLLARPWLASEYQEGSAWPYERRRDAFRQFHQELLSFYTSRIEGGSAQLLGKMSSFWEYLLAVEDRKKFKKIRKSSNLNTYLQAVGDLISSIR